MADAPIDFGILAGAGVPVREFAAGEVIFREGDPAAELYVIQSGSVDIRLGNRLLGTLPAHSVFGEMALVDAAPRHRGRGNRCQTCAGRREAVSVPGQPYAELRAQANARHGTPAENGEHCDLV